MFDGKIPMRLLLENSDCLERAQRFRPAKLDGLVASGGIVHRGRRECGHVTIGYPADLVFSRAIDSRHRIRGVEPERRAQPDLFEKRRPKDGVRHATFLQSLLYRSLGSV